MRWVSFREAGTTTDRCGLLDGEEIRCLAAGIGLADILDRLDDAAGFALRQPAAVVALDTVQVRPPIPRPPSVRDFYAFEQHVKTAREQRGLAMEPEWYELPVFYFSNPSAIFGPGDDVPAAPGTVELDYEVEVAAVVARDVRDADPDAAAAAIAGYMVMNDWSARDLQRREMKLNLGPAKGKDFATSLGPCLVTPDELDGFRAGKAYALAMTASVNGTEWSRGSLADIHWSFGEMIAHAARGTTVRKGDVIGSGTCGTGCILELALVHGADRYPWLKPGDVVSITVEGLGTLTNRVAAPAS